MPAPDSPEPERAGGGAKVLWVGALVLASGATAVLVLSDDARLLRLGLAAALWAALMGAFAVTRLRRGIADQDDHAADRQRIYELELEREVAARREFELEAENEARRRVAEESEDEVQALRAELRTLRESLEQILGRDMLVERVALRAESTRVRQLPEGEDDSGVAPRGRELPVGYGGAGHRDNGGYVPYDGTPAPSNAAAEQDTDLITRLSGDYIPEEAQWSGAQTPGQQWAAYPQAYPQEPPQAPRTPPAQPGPATPSAPPPQTVPPAYASVPGRKTPAAQGNAARPNNPSTRSSPGMQSSPGMRSSPGVPSSPGMGSFPAAHNGAATHNVPAAQNGSTVGKSPIGGVQSPDVDPNRFESSRPELGWAHQSGAQYGAQSYGGQSYGGQSYGDWAHDDGTYGAPGHGDQTHGGQGHAEETSGSRPRGTQQPSRERSGSWSSNRAGSSAAERSSSESAEPHPGAHTQGTSVNDLLAVYGDSGESGQRRRRRRD